MKKEKLFTERQRFRQWWVWLILLGINWIVFKQLVGGPVDLIAAGISILLTLLFVICRLDTVIKKNGIYVRLFPFHFKFKHYTWDTLTRSYVRQYSPIREYGGWGLRLGLFGGGTAFNISGDKGLQLEFTNNKKLLIGTNKPDELTETLNKIRQLKR